MSNDVNGEPEDAVGPHDDELVLLLAVTWAWEAAARTVFPGPACAGAYRCLERDAGV
jgi:hypothetical protein